MTEAAKEYVRLHLDEPIDRLSTATGMTTKKGRAELERFLAEAREEAAKAPPNLFARHKGTVAYTAQQGLADDARLSTGPNVEWRLRWDYRVDKAGD